MELTIAHCDSIATLLRMRLAQESSMRSLALELNLNLPTLWKFVKQGRDIGLGTAEMLLAHYGLTIATESDAAGAKIWHVNPTPTPNTIRAKARRAKAARKKKPAAAKKKGAKKHKGARR